MTGATMSNKQKAADKNDFVFEPVKDMRLIRKFMTHPNVYPWICDDFSPSPTDIMPIEHPSVFYICAKDKTGLLLLCMFIQQNAICWEIHASVFPRRRRARALAAAKAGIEWIWQNTRCKRLIAQIPVYNGTAYLFAKAAGLEYFGTNEKSFQKNGKLYDQILLGISRPTIGG
jgi:hypothetical protein